MSIRNSESYKSNMIRTENTLNKIESNQYETWNIRSVVLKEIGLTYQEYLSSEHWKKLKQKTLRRKRFKKCQKCDSDQNIQLHHKHYRFLMHIHELHSIVPLCKNCHNELHDYTKQNKLSVREATNIFLKQTKLL